MAPDVTDAKGRVLQVGDLVLVIGGMMIRGESAHVTGIKSEKGKVRIRLVRIMPLDVDVKGKDVERISAAN